MKKGALLDCRKRPQYVLMGAAQSDEETPHSMRKRLSKYIEFHVVYEKS